MASVCWAIWNTRNRVTFDKYTLKSPSVISFFSISLLVYQEGLQKDATDKSKLLKGAHKMKQVVAAVYSNRQAEQDLRQLVIIYVV
jgi:hypothetical protein